MDILRGCSFLLFVPFFIITAVSDAEKVKERKISIKPYNCPGNLSCHNQSIIHVLAEARDNNSTLHYLWTTYPVPTIVVAYTTLANVTVNIVWEKLTANNTHSGIEFKPPVNYTFGFALSTIYEYEDVDDKVKLSDHGKIVVHRLGKNTTWNMKVDNSSNKVTFTGNDSLIFECTASDSEDRESFLPHEKHTANSSRFILTLHNFSINTNKTRFAFELTYFVDDNGKLRVNTEKNIDDEYTPAVFETVYGKVGENKNKAFSQWKPIAYTQPKLGRKSQTRASAGGIKKVVDSGKRHPNIAELLMGKKYQSYGLNVSFGLAKDGFYQKHKYLTWSGMVGYGEPARSSLSFLVILIISIGLGLPLVIIIFGGAYVQIRKHCRKNTATSYGIIN